MGQSNIEIAESYGVDGAKEGTRHERLCLPTKVVSIPPVGYVGEHQGTDLNDTRVGDFLPSKCEDECSIKRDPISISRNSKEACLSGLVYERMELPSPQKPSNSWFASWRLPLMNGAVVGRKGVKQVSAEAEFQQNTYSEHVLTRKISGNASPLHADVSFFVSGEAVPRTCVEEQEVFDVECPKHDLASTDGLSCKEVQKGKVTNQGGGMFVKFVNVGYKATKREQKWCCKWGSKSAQGGMGKQILQGITGWVGPGEMLALMGPSGSGKTTLLNLLGGRELDHKNKLDKTGSITYDGLPFSKSMKRRMGFVTQDDILYPHLTVRETLTYAAMLRLPASVSRKEKIERAEQVMRQLGLERCRDTIIGNTFLRGVSGGERKRVCIGHEVLGDPWLIFLDEPTSGLDSTTALCIVHHLQMLAESGRTVVTTIHQPSSRIFHVFDTVLLLAEGRLAYFGKALDAMLYFRQLGFTPLIAMNPADFLLDLCSGNTNDMTMPMLDEGGKKVDALKYLEEEAKKRKSEVALLVGDMGDRWRAEKRGWAETWGMEVAILLRRGLRERRHEYLNWLKVVQVVATALLCGTLWWHSSMTSARIQDQPGLLFFIAIFWGFFPLFNAIFTFPLERALLSKERASDMYRLSSYFVARCLADLPLDLLLPSLFTLLVYSMAELRMSLLSFCLTLLVIFLTVITSEGVGLLIGAILLDVQKATTFGSVLVVALMLSGGFFIRHTPKFMGWLQYLSFQSYCYKLLLKIQYAPYYYNCTVGNDQRSGHEATSVECQSIIKALHGMKLTPGGQEVWSMLAMAVFCRVMAYMALRPMSLGLIQRKLLRCMGMIE